MQQIGLHVVPHPGPHDQPGSPGRRRGDQVTTPPRATRSTGCSRPPPSSSPRSTTAAATRRSRSPTGSSFVVRNIFTDFKRHDLGPNFHERNYDGTIRRQLLTTPLWGVANTAPYGHDGRSMNLQDVILRHGGEAQTARDRFANASSTDQRQRRRVPEHAGALPAGRHRVEPAAQGDDHPGLPAVRTRQHPAGRAVQRPDERRVNT